MQKHIFFFLIAPCLISCTGSSIRLDNQVETEDEVQCSAGDMRQINGQGFFCMQITGKKQSEKYCELYHVFKVCQGAVCQPLIKCILQYETAVFDIESCNPDCLPCIPQRDQELMKFMFARQELRKRELKLNVWVPLTEENDCRSLFWRSQLNREATSSGF